MSQDHREELAGNLLILIGIAAGIALILFLISWFWLTFWFYVFPLLVASVVVGVILKVISSLWLEDKIEETNSKYYLLYNYRMLGVVFPVLIVAVLLTFHADSKRYLVVEKQKGHEDKVITYLEWPKVNQFYNSTKRSWYTDSWFESLRAQANIPEIYDRQEVGNIAWMALFLGGPLFFFWFSRRDHEKEGVFIKEKVESKVKRERGILNEKIRDQEKIIESRCVSLRKEVTNLEAENKALSKENLVLKAKLEFAPEVPRPLSNAAGGGGVLDKDIL